MATIEREVLTDSKGSKYRIVPEALAFNEVCTKCARKSNCNIPPKEFSCCAPVGDGTVYDYWIPAPTLAALAAVMEDVEAGLPGDQLDPSRLAFQRACGMIEALRAREVEA